MPIEKIVRSEVITCTGVDHNKNYGSGLDRQVVVLISEYGSSYPLCPYFEDGKTTCHKNIDDKKLGNCYLYKQNGQ